MGCNPGVFDVSHGRHIKSQIKFRKVPGWTEMLYVQYRAKIYVLFLRRSCVSSQGIPADDASVGMKSAEVNEALTMRIGILSK